MNMLCNVMSFCPDYTGNLCIGKSSWALPFKRQQDTPTCHGRHFDVRLTRSTEGPIGREALVLSFTVNFIGLVGKELKPLTSPKLHYYVCHDENRYNT